ncbi:MAG: CHAT domain-containing protein [Caldilineaceae bacterium]|nr:CHAT domain-containing protein [Caldilineaceae bacterium]
MDASFSQNAQLTCPNCRRAFDAEIWLIVDAAARPDLLERIRAGALHDIPCPHCGEAGQIDAPLLLYRPDNEPRLVFSPAQGTTAEQDREQASGLTGALAQQLGNAWQDAWQEELLVLSRPLLAAALSDDPEAALAGMMDRAEAALEKLRTEDPEAYAQMEAAARAAADDGDDEPDAQAAPPLLQALNDFIRADSWNESRRIVQEHPDLLSDEADGLLAQAVDRARADHNQQAATVYAEHLALLRRCRAVGIEEAFAEKMGGRDEADSGEIPPELRPLLEAMAALPEEERTTLAGLFADAESMEELLAALEGHPHLRDALVAAAAGRSGPEIPPQFADDLQAAQQTETRYRQTGDFAALGMAQAAWRRILDHPDFDHAPDRFRLAVLNDAGGVFLRAYWARGRAADLDLALQFWTEAVEATPAGSPDLPSRLNNLGNGLSDRFARSGREADLEAARTSYRRACELGQESAVEEALRSARNWSSWALGRSAWNEAVDAGALGLAALDRLFAVQFSRADQENALQQGRALAAATAYAHAQMGMEAQATEVMEQGRARLLAEALEQNRRDLGRLPELGHADLYGRYQSILEERRRLLQIGEMEAAGEAVAGAPAVGARLNALDQLFSDLQTVIAEIRQIPGYEDFFAKPDFARIQSALVSADGTGAVGVYLLTTSVGGLALIVHGDGVAALQLPELTDEKLGELLRSWFGAYDTYLSEQNKTTRQGWYKAIEDITEKLWKLAMGPLAARLHGLLGESDPPPVVTLIPAGLLALLPLHAAWTQDPTGESARRYFLDDFAVNYAPSATALGHSRARAGAMQTMDALLAVDEPRPVRAGGLPNSKREVDAIGSLFGAPTVLRHAQATRAVALAELPGAAVAHFSCHGGNDWGDPLKSGLLMANDEMLTTRDLLGARLPDARLATLSACETGIVGAKLPDEVVMLPSAMVQAGYAGVAASLWSVNEISTAMLMVRFYEYWRTEGLAPVYALRAAQRWVRDTTNGEKADYFEGFVVSGAQKMAGGVAAEFFSAALLNREGAEARSFDHPVWWSAFTLTGV